MFVLPDVRRKYAHHRCTETTGGNRVLRAALHASGNLASEKKEARREAGLPGVA